MNETIQPTLLLRCKICEWRPDLKSSMAEVELHFKLDHPDELEAANGNVLLELVPYCKCDVAMELHHSKPIPKRIGGGFHDLFICPVDGNEAVIKRGK